MGSRWASPAAPDSQQGIDLSDLRCVFHIDKSVSRNPNLLYVRIYNMAPKTMAKVIAMKRVQVSDLGRADELLVHPGAVLHRAGAEPDVHIDVEPERLL